VRHKHPTLPQGRSDPDAKPRFLALAFSSLRYRWQKAPGLVFSSDEGTLVMILPRKRLKIRSAPCRPPRKGKWGFTQQKSSQPGTNHRTVQLSANCGRSHKIKMAMNSHEPSIDTSKPSYRRSLFWRFRRRYIYTFTSYSSHAKHLLRLRYNFTPAATSYWGYSC
jgi:hypothetical protein